MSSSIGRSGYCRLTYRGDGVGPGAGWLTPLSPDGVLLVGAWADVDEDAVGATRPVSQARCLPMADEVYMQAVANISWNSGFEGSLHSRRRLRNRWREPQSAAYTPDVRVNGEYRAVQRVEKYAFRGLDAYAGQGLEVGFGGSVVQSGKWYQGERSEVSYNLCQRGLDLSRLLFGKTSALNNRRYVFFGGF